MFETSKVRTFFQGRVNKYSSIYSKDRQPIWKILDFLFRRSVQKRFELTLEECSNIKNKKILDVGCGPGIYAVTLAKMEPAKVVGIDFSEEMLEKAQALAMENRVRDVCQFINSEFLRYEFEEKFDICLGIGLFDYIQNPLPTLQKFRGLCLEKAILSFPGKWKTRNIVRKIRLRILKCPVYFYTRKQLERLLKESGFNTFEIKNVDRDYFVIAK
ncbi:MAG: class I SAM-dependent methyltransferase [Candidatus Omnitrophota bacterium]